MSTNDSSATVDMSLKALSDAVGKAADDLRAVLLHDLQGLLGFCFFVAEMEKNIAPTGDREIAAVALETQPLWIEADLLDPKAQPPRRLSVYQEIGK